MNSDKKVLNQIYEAVYEKKIPKKESFMYKYNRLDDRINKNIKPLQEKDDLQESMTFEKMYEKKETINE